VYYSELPKSHISALSDNLVLCGEVCKHKVMKIMLLNVWRLKNSPV